MGIDHLIERIREKKTPIAVGLDPRLDMVPSFLLDNAVAQKGETLEAAADAVYAFNYGILEATHDLVPCVKLQSACYEALGYHGVRVFEETCKLAREHGLYVIADAKRGDIGSTSELYSAAFLGRVKVGQSEFAPVDADALTVNPYLGSDNVKPFLADCEAYDKAIFVLVRTSNKSSRELQLLMTPDRPLFHAVAELCRLWGKPLIGSYGYSSVGFVVGATHPREMAELRALWPEAFFLVPGYGAQGADARDCSHAFDELGRGAIINSSRAILHAWGKANEPDRFKEAARAEVLNMREALSRHINCL